MSFFTKFNLWLNAFAIPVHGAVLLAGAGSVLTPYFLSFHIVMIPIWLWIAYLERRA